MKTSASSPCGCWLEDPYYEKTAHYPEYRISSRLSLHPSADRIVQVGVQGTSQFREGLHPSIWPHLHFGFQKISTRFPDYEMAIKTANHTKTFIIPNIGFHSNSIECMLPQKGEPCLHHLGIAVPNLNEPTECYPFKILLAFLVHKIAPRNCPALYYSR